MVEDSSCSGSFHDLLIRRIWKLKIKHSAGFNVFPPNAERRENSLDSIMDFSFITVFFSYKPLQSVFVVSFFNVLP